MPSFHNTPGLDYSFLPLLTQEIFDATDKLKYFFSFLNFYCIHVAQKQIGFAWTQPRFEWRTELDLNMISGEKLRVDFGLEWCLGVWIFLYYRCIIFNTTALLYTPIQPAHTQKCSRIKKDTSVAALFNVLPKYSFDFLWLKLRPNLIQKCTICFVSSIPSYSLTLFYQQMKW